jgi:hypothetical protein
VGLDSNLVAVGKQDFKLALDDCQGLPAQSVTTSNRSLIILTPSLTIAWSTQYMAATTRCKHLTAFVLANLKGHQLSLESDGRRCK